MQNDRIEVSTVEEIRVLCCVRGYHIYKRVWTATFGEELMCQRELKNSIDEYAVAHSKKY